MLWISLLATAMAMLAAVDGEDGSCQAVAPCLARCLADSSSNEQMKTEKREESAVIEEEEADKVRM